MIQNRMTGGASIEDTLSLWATSLREAKQRIRPLFTQDHVANSAGQFLDALLGNEPRKTDWMPERIARMYLDTGDWGLPLLAGITTAPLLSEVGAIRVAEGFDPQTNLWCSAVPSVVVPDRPSKSEAAAASLVLRRRFRTFPFADAKMVQIDGVDAVDITRPAGFAEGGGLVSLLNAACRPCLHLAPGMLVTAPDVTGAGVGKGCWCGPLRPLRLACNRRRSRLGMTGQNSTNGWWPNWWRPGQWYFCTMSTQRRCGPTLLHPS
jgi:hypothetical protein